MNKTEKRVSISCRGVRGKVDPRTIERRAAKILAATDNPDAELSLLLCDDPFIRKLNLDYRRKDAPTDVLSFSMREGEVEGVDPKLLGDVVVSVDTAERQASKQKKTLTDEVTSLVIHGILHLLGYSHKTKAAEKAMFDEALRLEKIVLKRP